MLNPNNRIIILTLLVFVSYITGFAQLTAAYTDSREQFFVLDGSEIDHIEYQQIRSFKVGVDFLVYVDALENLVAYYGGKKDTVEKYHVSNYFVSGRLLVYSMGKQLVVYDLGKKQRLSFSAESYFVGDSIVAFYDQGLQLLKAYYKGGVYEIEDGITGIPFKTMLAGDNIVAYVDNANYLKIFYHGSLFEQAYLPMSFLVGANLVAYVESIGGFKVYYLGDEYEMETLSPNSYKVGDNMLAYIDQSGNFKIFDKGTVAEVSTFPPDFYKVKGNIVIFAEDQIFKCYYNGEIYTLENFVPDFFELEESILVYRGMQGELKVFYKGDVQTISIESTSDLRVFRSAVSFTLGKNKNLIFSQGELYQKP